MVAYTYHTYITFLGLWHLRNRLNLGIQPLSCFFVCLFVFILSLLSLPGLSSGQLTLALPEDTRCLSVHGEFCGQTRVLWERWHKHHTEWSRA